MKGEHRYKETVTHKTRRRRRCARVERGQEKDRKRAKDENKKAMRWLKSNPRMTDMSIVWLS